MVVLLASVLRLAWLGSSPPGLSPDEASNVYNAWCLSEFRLDEHRVAMPVFYEKAFNDGRTAMMLYALLPVEAIFGLSPAAVRLPCALAGAAAVWLLYRVVLALGGDRKLALAAALLLAVDPTHVQQSRSALESPLTPMLVLLSVLLWVRAWNGVGRAKAKRWLPWVTAGVVSGISCYGYAAIRVYLPLILIAMLFWVLAKRRPWRGIAIGTASFALLFAPLVYKHLTDPAMNARGRATRTWTDDDSPLLIVAKLTQRYVEHFSPKYLFMTGSTETLLAPPDGFGALPWVWLPLMAAGVYGIVKARKSSLGRFAIAAMLLYPAADVFSAAGNANVLRTLCGSWSLDLLAAFGVSVLAVRPLWRPGILGAGVSNALLHAYALLWVYPADAFVQYRRGCDIESACAFVKPIMDQYDATVFTTLDAMYAYPQVLLALGVAPDTYFNSTIARGQFKNEGGVEPDMLGMLGTLFFNVPSDDVGPLIQNALRDGKHRKSLWILRPEEIQPTDHVLQRVRLSHGFCRLSVIERFTPGDVAH